MKDKIDFIKTIFLVVFCVLFISFKDLYFLTGINETLLSGVLGGLGALIGMATYQLVNDKNNYIKFGVLGALTVLLITLSVTFSRDNINAKIEKQLTSYFDSITSEKINEVLKQPIDTNSLKPPKLTEAEYKRLVTCDICGYKAVCPDSNYCYNCFTMTYNLSANKLSEKKNWIRDEQLFWFNPDSATSKIHFFDPKIENGFLKDSLWKPSVSEIEVRQYHITNK